jgi:hypothetical protein
MSRIIAAGMNVAAFEDVWIHRKKGGGIKVSSQCRIA